MKIMKALLCMAMAMWSLSGFTAAMAQGRDSAPAARQTLSYQGIERSYVIRIPAGLPRDGGKLPLVLVLHGGGGNAENAEKMTGFTAKAEKEGFIVVYPEGSGRRPHKLLTWNAGHCCGYAMENKVDDVGFISALIDHLIEAYPIDPKRVYATGMSNGGMMTHRLGIGLSGKIAAIAPVVATLFGDEEKPAHPVSALMINGLQDTHVPFEGGPPGGRFTRAWDGAPTKSALEQAVFWANADGCTGSPAREDHGAVAHWQYHCPAGHAVELYGVGDNGHAWPGGQAGSMMGDTPGTALKATDAIWDFFRAHAK